MEVSMLVLSRKLGEKLVISENITVTVVGIDRGRVRLGFDAPKDISILRAELAGGELDPDLALKPADWKTNTTALLNGHRCTQMTNAQ
jgi:carbon storage regulator